MLARGGTHLNHDALLDFAEIGSIGAHECAQQPQVLNVPTMSFNAMHKVLDDFIFDVLTQLPILQENVTNRLSLQKLK